MSSLNYETNILFDRNFKFRVDIIPVLMDAAWLHMLLILVMPLM